MFKPKICACRIEIACTMTFFTAYIKFSFRSQTFHEIKLWLTYCIIKVCFSFICFFIHADCHFIMNHINVDFTIIVFINAHIVICHGITKSASHCNSIAYYYTFVLFKCTSFEFYIYPLCHRRFDIALSNIEFCSRKFDIAVLHLLSISIKMLFYSHGNIRFFC